MSQVIKKEAGYAVVHSTRSVWYDVDNTLVFSLREYPHQISNEIVKINGRKFWVHVPHVETIKDFKARGHTVVIWSAGGAEWAEMVVKALQLEDCVDLVISKPDWFVDDKPANMFMAESKRFFKGMIDGPSSASAVASKDIE